MRSGRVAVIRIVSPTLLEASRVDGATRFQMFRYVTLPALRPSITIVLILSITNSLKAFDIVYGMTQGGPAQSTQMLALWAFTQAMRGRRAIFLLILFGTMLPFQAMLAPLFTPIRSSVQEWRLRPNEDTNQYAIEIARLL